MRLAIPLLAESCNTDEPSKKGKNALQETNMSVIWLQIPIFNRIVYVLAEIGALSGSNK